MQISLKTLIEMGAVVDVDGDNETYVIAVGHKIFLDDDLIDTDEEVYSIEHKAATDELFINLNDSGDGMPVNGTTVDLMIYKLL